jgi:hypothetical protein
VLFQEEGILPGDRIVYVNNVSLQHASLDTAVQVSSPFTFFYYGWIHVHFMSIFFCLSTLAILNRQFVPDLFSSPSISYPVPKFLDPVFVKTSPKRSFSVIQNERFGLVFAKTGSRISGTGFGTEDAPLFVLEQRMRHYLFDSYEEQLSCTFTS